MKPRQACQPFSSLPPSASSFSRSFTEGASLLPDHAALLGSDTSAQAAENDLGYFRSRIMLQLPLELAASHTSPDHPCPPSSLTHNH